MEDNRNIEKSTENVPTEQAAEKPVGKKRKYLWIILGAVALCGVLTAILLPNIFEQRRVSRYNHGAEYLEQGDYVQAREAFLALGEYEDAPALAAYAEKGIAYTAARENMERGEFEQALARFETLSGFKDSETLIEECRHALSYERGKLLYEEGDYAAALEAWENADGYKDSEALIEECRHALSYERGRSLYEEGDYAAALEALEAADGYGDSPSLMEQCRMLLTQQQIADAMENLDFALALSLLESDAGAGLENRDAMIAECNRGLQYAEAEEAFDDRLFYTAYGLFHDLGSYRDAQSRAEACIQSKPSTGETYRNTAYGTSGCSLKIDPNRTDNSCVYFKIYAVSGSEEILVSCVFINSGATATVRLPAGTYVLKTASSTGNWYGEKEMFGSNGIYQRLRSSNTSDHFTLERNGEYILTLSNATNGNVGSQPEAPGKF